MKNKLKPQNYYNPCISKGIKNSSNRKQKFFKKFFKTEIKKREIIQILQKSFRIR